MGVSDPRDNHSTFQRFWNDGNVDSLVDLYDESASCVAGADQILIGHAEIRAMLEGLSCAHCPGLDRACLGSVGCRFHRPRKNAVPCIVEVWYYDRAEYLL